MPGQPQGGSLGHELQPVEEDPYEQELNAFWGDVGKDLVKSSIGSIDETARQIIAVDGILEGLYFHAIVYSDLRGALSGGLIVLYAAPVVLLLASLVAALAVFLPDHYRVDLRIPKALCVAHRQIVTSKLHYLRIAAYTLILSIGALLVAVIAYLG